MTEAPADPQLAARGTLRDRGRRGPAGPGAAVRRRHAGAAIGALPPGRIARPGAHTREVLAGLGFADAEELLASGAVWQA